MPSTNLIDFSVRQNKAIERTIAFESIRTLLSTLNLADPSPVYIGFGSVWFVDFDLAHRVLGINTMISIESNQNTYTRAVFNKPYKTVEVLHGYSYDEIPKLVDERDDLSGRPWVVWLDYDDVMDEDKLLEIDYLVEYLPKDSILLVTFSANLARYGSTVLERLNRFVELYGDAFPDERHPEGRRLNREDVVMESLAQATIDHMEACALRVDRAGRFVPAFDLRYKDATPMVTVGGVLPNVDHVTQARQVVSLPTWESIRSTAITVPPLTSKEVSALRALLPTTTPVTRDVIKKIGFDLEQAQLMAFIEHYLRYPSFVQTYR